MAAQPSTSSRSRLPAGLVAAGLALLVATFAKVLFRFADSGSASDVLILIFPFVTGGAGLYAAWTAIRALRTTKASGYGKVIEVCLTILAFVALLIDLAVIGFAAFIGLMIIHGPMVQ